jgi:hypothetical protein
MVFLEGAVCHRCLAIGSNVELEAESANGVINPEDWPSRSFQLDHAIGGLSFQVDLKGASKLYLKSAVEASPEGREAEDFGVFFVEQVFDPAG